MSKRTEFLFKMADLLSFARKKGIEVICYTFYRTPEEQNKQFKAGLSNCDGHVKKSKHQAWLAMDLCVLEDGMAIWDTRPYLPLGEEWERLGGIWGGRWGSPHDPYHFELR